MDFPETLGYKVGLGDPDDRASVDLLPPIRFLLETVRPHQHGEAGRESLASTDRVGEDTRSKVRLERLVNQESR